MAAVALAVLGPLGAAPAHAASATQGPLISPTNDDAMLNMLMEDGVSYTTSTTAADASSYSSADATLVIDQDETNLSNTDISALATSTWGRVIILNTDSNLLAAFAPGVSTAGAVSPGRDASNPVAPNCDQADASAAGSVVMPSETGLYSLPPASSSATATPSDGASSSPSSSTSPQISDVTGCYAAESDGRPAMVALHNTATGGDVILLGWTDFTENEYLTQQGDAALALRLFGAHSTLVWLATQFTLDENLSGCQGIACGASGGATPYGTSSAGSGQGAGGSGGNGGTGGGGGNGGGGGSAQAVTLAQLIPHWIWWMLLQLVVAAAALAYWRSRRLGRLVGESLPVKVRAAETVEGHANLYRRAAAHGRAAGLLRSAAARRIAPLLGLPAGPAGRSPATLVGPVAERLGWPAELVQTILAGEAPTTEADLVRLTDQLDHMEQEVRSP